MNIRREYYGLAILVFLLALIPFGFNFNNYYLLILVYTFLYSTLVVAWNIIGGFAGQFDMGAGGYMGLGGVITGLLLIQYNITPWIGMFLGGGGAALTALSIGFPTFRYGLKDLWYALSSYALVIVMSTLFLLWKGPVALQFPVISPIYDLNFQNNYPYFYLSLIILATTLVINVKIRYSKMGYYFMAIRENEDAAAMLSVDVRKYKLIALLIYAFIAGASGGIFVTTLGYIDYTVFSGSVSLQTGLLGVIGGLGSLAGPPLTALILVTASQYSRDFLGSVTIFGQTLFGLEQMGYAIAVIIIVLFKPAGLGVFFDSLIRKAAGLIRIPHPRKETVLASQKTESR